MTGDDGSSFEFGTANRVVFGAGRSAELPALIQRLGRQSVGLHRIPTASGTGDADRCAADARRRSSRWPANRPSRWPAAAVEAARAQGADVVVAIGGGSVLDLGKAVAMLLGNGGDPLDYLEVIGAGTARSPQPSVPFIAVPTTAGTGAEVTANAVLASPEHGRKASLRSALMLPRVALVDPLLTLDCPPSVTAASGLDALTQCLEPFVSRAGHSADRRAGRGGPAPGRDRPAGGLRGRLRRRPPAPTWRCAACSAGCPWQTRNSVRCMGLPG